MRKYFTSLCVLLAAFASTGAQAVSLQALFDGATITVDDKLFDNWVLFDVTDPIFTPAIDLTQIEVTGLTGLSGDPLDPLNPGPGLHFEANGQLTVIDDDFLDLNFGFDVTVLDPRFWIKDNSLDLTGFDIVGDGGLILIEETVFDGIDEIAFKDVFVDNLFLDEKLHDSKVFDRQRTISVEKNILVAGDFPGDVVELISFEQRFSQVPEPTTLALLSLGLLGFGIGRRRKA